MEEVVSLVDVIGPCTRDVRDCEIMRAAIALKDTDNANDYAQNIRRQLAESACNACVRQFLADVPLGTEQAQ